MLKETITYEDYNGVERTEDLYFNLTKRELNDFGLDGYAERIQEIQKEIETDTHNPNELYELYMVFIIRAYGRKSDDGTRFIKNDAITEAFTQSAAFEALSDKLLESVDYANDFILGVLPKRYAEEAAKEINKVK